MDQQQPLQPFEHWALDSGGVRRVSRPLLYVLQHVVLPQAVHQGHPMLDEALSGSRMSMLGFGHLIALSSARCEGANGWPDDVSECDPYYQYKDRLMEYVAAARYDHSGTTNWVIRMPPPVAPPEAHFVAIWGYGQPGATPRYFTLELSERPGYYFVCEWDHEATHRTYEETPRLTSDGFDKRVRALAGDA